MVKVFFQPGANIDKAIAQVTAISQTQLRQLPPGTTPPLVITYSASSVPILQLALSGQKLSEQQLFDLGVNFIRTRLVTVPGAAIPYPYGGKQRQIQVDLNTTALQAKGLSPLDVVNAISAQNLILPAGTSKIGALEYDVDINGSPQTVEELNDLPDQDHGEHHHLHPRCGARARRLPAADQHRARERAARFAADGPEDRQRLHPRHHRRHQADCCRGIQAGLPPELQIRPLADQSLFVRASIDGVVREAMIAACLTGLMILIFLGSWRSTLIIAVSIPLSILTSIIVMSALGETINIMTLGGLALAVGILVDDATVEIENINRNLAQGKELERAILDGAQQIAVPAFVSTLSICIVFVPMFFLTGVARYLFVPLAEAVVFAMLASYLLSRTLVPTMAKYLLKGHEAEADHVPAESRNPLVRLQIRFEEAFERFRERYRGCWKRRCSTAGALFCWRFVAFCAASLVLLVPWLGQDFFPAVDSGQFKLHVRAPTGTRIEETARLCDLVEQSIREQIPPERDRQHHRQHRAALQQHQPVVQQFGAHRAGRRRHPGQSVNEHHHADGGVRARSAHAAGPRVSRRHVFLPAGGHRQPDSELRPARADRHPDRGPQPGGQPRVRRQAAGPHQVCCRASPICGSTSLQSAQAAHQRGSHQGASRWATRSAMSPTTC